MLSGYGKLWNWGHAQLEEFAADKNMVVSVQEKLDGSQLSFGVDTNGVFAARSKNVQMDLARLDGMFQDAVTYLISVQDRMTPGWTYRAETLSSARHNAIQYGRRPNHGVVIFDIDTGDQKYLSLSEIQAEAEKLQVEAIQELYRGELPTGAELEKLMNEAESMLGGGTAAVEGIAIKPADTKIYDRNGKLLMAKMVKENFKETNRELWKDKKRGKKDFIEHLGGRFAVEARWLKAVQKLKEEGRLTRSPQDIAALMTATKEDIETEEEDYIKELLWKQFKHEILKGGVKGLPEWYKKEIAAQTRTGQGIF